MIKFIRKALAWVLATMLLLVLIGYAVLRLPYTQNYLTDRTEKYLSEKLGTEVIIGGVDLEFPKSLVIYEFYLADQEGDTLQYINKLSLNIDVWALSRKHIIIHNIFINDVKSGVKKISEDDFNYSFIIQAFNSDAPDQNAENSTSWLVSIENIEINKAQFKFHDPLDTLFIRLDFDQMVMGFSHFNVSQLDKIVGKVNFRNAFFLKSSPENELKIKIGDYDLSECLINMKQSHIDLKRLGIKDVAGYFNQFRASSNPPAKKDSIVNLLDTPWTLKASQVLLNKINFSYDNEVKLPIEGFDPDHLNIADLSATINDIHIDSTTFSAQIKTFKAIEQGGLDVQQLTGFFHVTDHSMDILDVNLLTPSTEIESNIQVEFPDYQSLFSLSSDLHLRHDLNISKVGTGDMYYFIPDLDTLPLPNLFDGLALNSSIVGNISSLKLSKLDILHNDEEVFSVSGDIEHIMNTDSMFLDLKFRALNPFIVKLLALFSNDSNYYQLPERIKLTGHASGGLTNIKSAINLNTNRGELWMTLAFINVSDPSYEISMQARQLDLGYLFRRPEFGKTTFITKVNGLGENLKELQMALELTIDKLELYGYDYQDMILTGNANDGNAIIQLESHDANLDFELESDIDYRDLLIKTITQLTVKNVNFENLGWTEKRMHARGQIQIETIGNSLDSIQLTVITQDTELRKESIPYKISPSVAKINLSKNLSDIDLDFPFLKGYYNSNFSIFDTEEVLNKEIISGLIGTDSLTNLSSSREVKFSISSIDPTLIEALFIPQLDTLVLNRFNGRYDGNSHQVDLELDLPLVDFRDIRIDSAYVSAHGGGKGLRFQGGFTKITSGNFISHQVALSGSNHNEGTTVRLVLKDELDNIPLSVATRIAFTDSSYVFNILADSLVLGYNIWQIDHQNEIRTSPRGINIQQLIMDNNEEIISFTCESQQWNAPIHAQFEQFRLGRLSDIMSSEQYTFDGLLSSQTLLQNYDSDLLFQSEMDIRNFSFSRDTIGNIHFTTENTNPDWIDMFLKIEGKHNVIRGNGAYFTSSDSINANLSMESVDLSSFSSATTEYLDHLQGKLSGQIHVLGPITRPSLEGGITFDSTSFSTKYLGTYFQMEHETLKFTNDRIIFDQFKLSDKAKNPATISGYVGSSDLESYIFNLELTSDKFQLLNTQKTGAKDELFFGSLVTTSNVNLTGTSSKPVINARIKIIEGSDITVVVPEQTVGTVEHEGVVQFVSKIKEIKPDSLVTNQAELYGVSLLSNLEIMPEAVLKIVIDRSAGDFLRVQGKSLLSYNIEPNGIATLTGTYEVQKGDYELTFYNFVKKKFEIEKGSNITWIGDPYNARLNVTAIYAVSTSSLPLIESQLTGSDEVSRNIYKQRLPFMLRLMVGGEIQSPDIGFHISLPPQHQNFQNGTVAGKLLQLNDQESELNKQVFSLLLFNRFLQENSFSGGAGGALSSTARNSVSQLLTEQLNNLSGKYIKGVKVTFGIESYEDYSSGNARGSTDLKLELSKDLLNEKLTVTLGSNVGLEGEQKQNAAKSLAQDVELEYKLDNDGVYRLKAFRKNQYEGIIDGELVKTGVGISIRKEFDSWEGFFRELKSTNTQDENP